MRGQVATDAKSNEITAIARLRELPHLKGGIVTIDAVGCQTKIAAPIIAQGGDDLLALKDNQGTRLAEGEEAFIDESYNASVSYYCKIPPGGWLWNYYHNEVEIIEEE